MNSASGKWKHAAFTIVSRDAVSELGFTHVHEGAKFEHRGRDTSACRLNFRERLFNGGIGLFHVAKTQMVPAELQLQVDSLLVVVGLVEFSLCFLNLLPAQVSVVAVLNNLAWILATSNDSQLRNPNRALDLATSICKSRKSPDANQLDTLAAAYAATGDFSNAVATANRAQEIAKSNSELTSQIATRITLYRQSKPYRE